MVRNRDYLCMHGIFKSKKFVTMIKSINSINSNYSSKIWISHTNWSLCHIYQTEYHRAEPNQRFNGHFSHIMIIILYRIIKMNKCVLACNVCACICHFEKWLAHEWQWWNSNLTEKNELNEFASRLQLSLQSMSSILR